MSLQKEENETQVGECHVRAETQEEGQVTAEAETDMRQSQAKECPGWTAATRARTRQGKFYPTGFTGSSALQIPDFGLPASRTMKESISVVLSHLVCGSLSLKEGVSCRHRYESHIHTHIHRIQMKVWLSLNIRGCPQNFRGTTGLGPQIV